MTQIRDTLADEGNKRLTTKRHRGIRYAITVATAIFANRSIRRCRPYEENERWSALLSPSAEATRDRRICITLEGGWSYRRYVQSEYHVPTKQIFLLLPLPEQEVCVLVLSLQDAYLSWNLWIITSSFYDLYSYFLYQHRLRTSLVASTIGNFSFIFPFRDFLVRSLHATLKNFKVFSFLKLLAKLLHQVSFWILC